MTRAEQLADKLRSARRWHDLTDDECEEAAAELRRLSAVEIDQANAIAAMRTTWDGMQRQLVRQSELLQQAKEAMEGVSALSVAQSEFAYLAKGIGTSSPNGKAWLALRAVLSAINEWEKSK